VTFTFRSIDKPFSSAWIGQENRLGAANNYMPMTQASAYFPVETTSRPRSCSQWVDLAAIQNSQFVQGWKQVLLVPFFLLRMQKAAREHAHRTLGRRSRDPDNRISPFRRLSWQLLRCARFRTTRHLMRREPRPACAFQRLPKPTSLACRDGRVCLLRCNICAA
jgi:hypothetical protein